VNRLMVWRHADPLAVGIAVGLYEHNDEEEP
jgi:hypothetical protein